MKKSLATFIGALSLLVPFSLAADSLVPIGPSPEQLLARSAAVSAFESGASVLCLVSTSKSSVRVDELFSLWWGSYGSVDGSGWSPTGSYTIVAAKPGVYEYAFTFRGADGSTSTCRTTVSVS